MEHVSRFAKYQLTRFYAPVLSFYVTVVAIAIATSVAGASGEINGGSALVIFIVGLNCFKTSYLFSQANNLSRRSFYFATLLAILILAVAISLVDLVVYGVLRPMIEYQTLPFANVYQMTGFTRLFWAAAVLTLCASVGWMITMLYYRANPIVKVLISLSPFAVASAFRYFNILTAGRLATTLSRFAVNALGLAGGMPNPHTAMLSFSLASVVILALNYLLMYKTPVKSQ